MAKTLAESILARLKDKEDETAPPILEEAVTPVLPETKTITPSIAVKPTAIAPVKTNSMAESILARMKDTTPVESEIPQAIPQTKIDKSRLQSIFETVSNIPKGAGLFFAQLPQVFAGQIKKEAKAMGEEQGKATLIEQYFPPAAMKRVVSKAIGKVSNIDEAVVKMTDKVIKANKEFVDKQESLKMKGTDFTDKLAYGIGSGMASLGTFVAAAAVSKNPAVGGILSGFLESGSKYLERIEAGDSEAKARNHADIHGLLMGGLESKGLHLLFEKSAAKVGKTFAQKIVPFISRLLIEPTQEASQSATEIGLDIAFKANKRTVIESAQEIGMSALVALFTGGGVVTTMDIVNRIGTTKKLEDIGVPKETINTAVTKITEIVKDETKDIKVTPEEKEKAFQQAISNKDFMINQAGLLQKSVVPKDDIIAFIKDSIVGGKSIRKITEDYLRGNIEEDEAIDIINNDYAEFKNAKPQGEISEEMKPEEGVVVQEEIAAEKAKPEIITEEDKTLIEEAKKYKTADEFVKAKTGNINNALNALENDVSFQEWFSGSKIKKLGRNSKLERVNIPEVYYHRSDANFLDFKKMVNNPEYRDTGEAGIYFSNKPRDIYYGKNEYASILNIKNPLKTNSDFSSLSNEKMNELISEGYDGIITPDETIIFKTSQAKIIAKNNKQIINKSQLTDIWNKAHGKIGRTQLEGLFKPKQIKQQLPITKTEIKQMTPIKAYKTGERVGKKITRIELTDKFRTKIKDMELVKKDVINYIQANLPIEKRGHFLNVVNNIVKANNTPAVMQDRLFNAKLRIDNAIDKYEKQTLRDSIYKKVANVKKSGTIAIDYKPMLNNIVKNLKIQQMGVADLLVLNDKIDLLIKVGKLKLKVFNEIYNLEAETILKDIASQKGMKLLEKEGLITPGIGEKVVFTEKMKNYVIEALNLAQDVDLAITPMDIIFDILDGNKDYQGALYKHFKAKSNFNYRNYLRQSNASKLEVINLARRLKLKMGNFERIGVYAANQQAGGLEKLLDLGFTKDEINSINLTDDEKQFYNFIRNKLDESRPSVERLMKDVYNMSLGYIKNYFPFRTNYEAMNEFEIAERLKDEFDINRKNISMPYTKTRTNMGSQKIKINAMEIYTQHMDNVIYATNMARDNKMLAEIVKTTEMRDKIGTKGQKLIIEWLDLIARKGGIKAGQRVKALDWLRNNTSAMTMAYKLSSFLVQSTALFDGAAQIGTYAFSGLADAVSNPELSSMIVENIPELKYRMGDDPAMDEFTNNNALTKFKKAGYKPMQSFDKIIALGVANGAYMKYLDEHKIKYDPKKPNNAALLEATRIMNKSQVSTVFLDLPSIISRGGLTGNVSVDRLLSQFQTFLYGRWGTIRHDLWNLGIKTGDYDKAGRIAFWLAIASLGELGIRKMTKEIWDFILGTDSKVYDDDNIWKEYVKTSLGNIPYLSPIVSMLGYGSLPIPSLAIINKLIVNISRRLKDGKTDNAKYKGYLNALVLLTGLSAGMPGAMQANEIGEKLIDKYVPSRRKASFKII